MVAVALNIFLYFFSSSFLTTTSIKMWKIWNLDHFVCLFLPLLMSNVPFCMYFL